MNRRRFLEMIGMATVGGAVAYSFPSVIVPKNIQEIGFWDGGPKRLWFNFNATATPINFPMLDEAYRRLCKGNLEPNSIFIPVERLQEMRDMTYGYLKFHGADIKVDPYIKDGSLYIENPKFRTKEFEGFSKFEIT